jgi:membrane fusion protein, heavy metal efflux system
MNKALLYAIGIASVLAGCGEKAEEVKDYKATVKGDVISFPAGAPQIARLVTEKVEPPSERELILPGRIVWDEDRTVRIFTPFAGRVDRILAKAGDRVTAGQPLAELASADFGQAQSDARRAEADFAVADAHAKRMRELNANGVASAKELQQAEADLSSKGAERERAVGRRRAYGGGEGVDSRFVLKSPVAGTVVERNINPGQELRPDQPGAPLFVVSDPSKLWVMLDSGESDAREIKPGMELVIRSPQMPEDAFSGELVQLADFVDPTARTIKLRGTVPNPGRALRAEMFVNARMKLPKGNEPVVAARAVYLEGVRRYVWARTGEGQYARRAVRVGPEVDSRMAVYSGLKEGDEVVVTGGLMLQQILSGARTEPEPEKKKP